MREITKHIDLTVMSIVILTGLVPAMIITGAILSPLFYSYGG